MRARDQGLGAGGRINLIDKTLIKPLNVAEILWKIVLLSLYLQND